MARCPVCGIEVVGWIVTIRNPFDRQGGKSPRALLSRAEMARQGQAQESRG